MKKSERNKEIDRILKNFHSLRMDDMENEQYFQKLMSTIDTSKKKGKNMAYFMRIITIVVAMCVFIIGGTMLKDHLLPLDQTNQGSYFEEEEPAIPILEELDMTLVQASSTEWEIERNNGLRVGSISFISEEEFQNRYLKTGIFEKNELGGYQYPITYIREHVKRDNIIQTLHYYINRNHTDAYHPYVHIQFHPPAIEKVYEEEAMNILKSYLSP